MPHVGHAALLSMLSSASAPAAGALPPNFGPSYRYLLAHCSHRCSSSNWPGPRTSVMCSVAGFGHFWHLCIVTVPARERRASSAILTRGTALSRNGVARRKLEIRSSKSETNSKIEGANLTGHTLLSFRFRIIRRRFDRLRLFLQAVAAVDLAVTAAFRTGRELVVYEQKALSVASGTEHGNDTREETT